MFFNFSSPLSLLSRTNQSLAYAHLMLQTWNIDIYVTVCRSDYCSHWGPTSIHAPYNSDLRSFRILLLRASIFHLFCLHRYSHFVLFCCTQYFPSSSPKFGDLIFQKNTHELRLPSPISDLASLLLTLPSEPFFCTSFELIPWFVCRNAPQWLGIPPQLLILRVFLPLFSLFSSMRTFIVAPFLPLCPVCGGPLGGGSDLHQFIRVPLGSRLLPEILSQLSFG
jgi:hypothetical protein